LRDTRRQYLALSEGFTCLFCKKNISAGAVRYSKDLVIIAWIFFCIATATRVGQKYDENCMKAYREVLQ